MLTVRIVPCLDVDAGRVVKGTRFQQLRDCGDPATLAGRYARDGADEVVVLDISATISGRSHALATTEAVRAVVDVPLTIGGGVRTLDDAKALLERGADKVAVNSAAVRDPELLRRMADAFGSQAVVLAVDALPQPDGQHRVRTHAGTTDSDLLVVDWIRRASELGIESKVALEKLKELGEFVKLSKARPGSFGVTPVFSYVSFEITRNRCSDSLVGYTVTQHRDGNRIPIVLRKASCLC